MNVVKIIPESLKSQTSYAPLCLLGQWAVEQELLKPLKEKVHIPQKMVKHSPNDKLIDVLISILSGGTALYQINTNVRSDPALQQAFGRESCAEQSTVADTLDHFTQDTIQNLREAIETIYFHKGKIFQHDFNRKPLILDIDLTGLPASPEAEGSTKGYFPDKRNRTGRQLARVTAPQYKEIIWEKLYPGNTTSHQVLKEAVKETERILGLDIDKEKQKKTLLRTDGGFGTDDNINWILWRGYQLITKGYSGTRAKKVAATVEVWQEGPTQGQKLGIPTKPHRYARKTKTVARRWQDKKGKWHQDLLITTLVDLNLNEVAKLYDGRDGMEVQIKGDKHGLGLAKRRKKRFYAQEALILLAQLAHNLLVWFQDYFLTGTKAAKLGTERLVKQVLNIPGQIHWRWKKKVKLVINTHHPWANAFLQGVKNKFSLSG